MHKQTPSKLVARAEKHRGEKTTLGLELVFYSLLTVVMIQALGYYWQDSLKPMPRLLWVFRTIEVYLHEGGHFISSPFGETLMIFGGSFWQIMLPLLLFGFAVFERSRLAPFPLFYAGLCAMDVSYYARDAMFRIQPLIGGMHKNMHDWFRLAIRWELHDDIETIADILYYTGAMFCLGAIGAGFFIALRSYFRPTVQASPRLTVAVDDFTGKDNVPPAPSKKESGSETQSRSEDPWGLPVEPKDSH